MSPILGIIASGNQSQFISTTAYESIATAVGTGSSGTVTFSSIPSTYTHLQVRINARTNYNSGGNDYLIFRFNSDSGANYTAHGLEADASALTPFNSTSITEAYGTLLATTGANTSIMGSNIVDILDYSSTVKNKTMRQFGGANTGSTGNLRSMSNLWINTSAINSITITALRSGTNFSSNSTFALYGIKG